MRIKYHKTIVKLIFNNPYWNNRTELQFLELFQTLNTASRFVENKEILRTPSNGLKIQPAASFETEFRIGQLLRSSGQDQLNWS